MLYASGNEVDAGGLNTGVAQHIRQFGYIPAGSVEGPGEQVPQVVGEYFRGGHAGLFVFCFHLRPDLAARDTFAASGEKDFAGSDFLFPDIFL